MKQVCVAFISVFLSSSLALAQSTWKQVANETIWPQGPAFRETFVRSDSPYSEIRFYVSNGNLRIRNAFIFTDKMQQIPLWQMQGDYRSPRMNDVRFLQNKVRSVRYDLQNLDTNRPAMLQIFVR